MAVIMTGGTRGLGLYASQFLADLPGQKIMGVREGSSAPPQWQGHPLDLANLGSVRAFAAGLPDEQITHLVLNAGAQLPTCGTRTIDGSETTFATNHLAHYLLLRLVLHRLATGARIVITSSGTHDPGENTGVPPPRHACAELLAHPDCDPQSYERGRIGGLRAYSSSKLCNVMTVRHLAGSDDAIRQRWTVLAYDPGLTPGTGLVRSQPWFVRSIVWPLMPLFIPLSKGMNRLADAGRGLAELSTTAQPPNGCVYAALRKGQLSWPEPSQIARDDIACKALWDTSELMVGLS